ncbi:MoxR-like ATPase [Schinkia azotoformans MEV2011]|uniref:MoxR-like ATPase n=1 Tax=Schinkia azotoformans MEV2011 TaxID=1348973 RepID=A0A072NI02_SCHAZ|nr:MoxR family ATPase [Schinkia azotoformans]KEF36887.1 MoxR-like ATPase [Schinkia azotoformans MEV2011]MEC1695261.1 MoxR family ATPase [Schinkia azotoformans]MEC1717563.1 MoxR family ATPase [Schinkia azotoformans]MEC1723718.1 MoxR family ATPase [Schinkia azotoformans]MEC1742487.1 MoxR family ATPase [Schinkia azotoformans]
MRNRHRYEQQLHPVIEKVTENIEKVIIGKREEVTLCLVALLAQGHVLLEDVPGVGKTMMVRSLAKSINATFKRIQFTPDLMPSDVTGISIYNPKELKFEYRPGPIMGNIVLADEINRTSPKTQSALLESLEEGHITVDGATMPLPKPFMVLATQNPIEYEGTYPLPEAQLDRFLLKMKMGYPTPAEEIRVLENVAHAHPIDELYPVLSIDELLDLQKIVKKVFVDETIRAYIVEISNRTRNHPSIYLGVSPRGSIALMRAAQAYAFICDRDYVIPDDVKYLTPFVFGHRIILNSESSYKRISTEEILIDIIDHVQVPVHKEWR